jgi:hypothetical protein
MDWLPDGTFDRGMVGGVMLGMAFFVLVCLMRAFARIRTFGLWNYFCSALTIEDDSLGLFLTLLVLLLVVVLVFYR